MQLILINPLVVLIRTDDSTYFVIKLHIKNDFLTWAYIIHLRYRSNYIVYLMNEKVYQYTSNKA